MLSTTEDQAAGRQLLLAPPCPGTLMYHKEQGRSLGSANLLSSERSASKRHLPAPGQCWPSLIPIRRE